MFFRPVSCRHVLFASFLFCCTVLAWTADTYNEYAGRGLFINSVPTGATVYIDGVEKGTTPFSVASIKEGRHQIRLKKDGYENRLLEVVVREGSRVEVTLDLAESKGRVLLNVQREPSASSELPFEPRIMVDGAVMRENPVALAYGWRTVTIEAFGWEQVRERIHVIEGGEQTFEFTLKPAVFTVSNTALYRKRLNPNASGTTGSAGVGFFVSGPGQGLLEVFDDNNIVIYRQPLGPFTERRQQVEWYGKKNTGFSGEAVEPETVKNGTYKIWISTGEKNAEADQFFGFIVQVDSRFEARAHNASSSASGLMFAVSAATLPAYSFQLQSDILAGIPLLQESWKGLPFALSFRFSRVDNLEVAAAFNANPRLYADSEWGGGVSVKWQFYSPFSNTSDVYNPLRAAVVLSYGWMQSGPYSIFGMGTGLGLRLPVTLRIAEYVDLTASPLVLWASEKGYPASFVPRVGIEGGVFATYKTIAAGVSLRWDYAPPGAVVSADGATAGVGPLATALEIKWQPLDFYLSLAGGYWQWNDSRGAFVGLGMGIVY